MNLQSYVQDFRGGAHRAGEVAVRYADSIIDRLDALIEATRAEEFQEHRREFRISTSDGVPVEVAQIPANQTWILEVVTGTTAAANVTAFVGTSDSNWGEYPPAEWAKQSFFAATDKPDIVLRGGSTIFARANGGAAVFYLAFRVRTTPHARSPALAGRPEHRPRLEDPRGDPAEELRHGGVVTPVS